MKCAVASVDPSARIPNSMIISFVKLLMIDIIIVDWQIKIANGTNDANSEKSSEHFLWLRRQLFQWNLAVTLGLFYAFTVNV